MLWAGAQPLTGAFQVQPLIYFYIFFNIWSIFFFILWLMGFEESVSSPGSCGSPEIKFLWSYTKGARREHVGLCLGQGGEAAGLGIPPAVRKEEFRVGRSVPKQFASPATSASPHPTTT